MKTRPIPHRHKAVSSRRALAAARSKKVTVSPASAQATAPSKPPAGTNQTHPDLADLVTSHRRGAKIWALCSPEGEVFRFCNLKDFVEQNAELLEAALRSDDGTEDGVSLKTAYMFLSRLRPGHRGYLPDWRGWTWADTATAAALQPRKAASAPGRPAPGARLSRLLQAIKEPLAADSKPEPAPLPPAATLPLNEDICTAKQAAALLNIPLPTIYYLTKNAKLPSFRIGGRWKYRRSDLQLLTLSQGGAEFDQETLRASPFQEVLLECKDSSALDAVNTLLGAVQTDDPQFPLSHQVTFKVAKQGGSLVATLRLTPRQGRPRHAATSAQTGTMTRHLGAI